MKKYYQTEESIKEEVASRGPGASYASFPFEPLIDFNKALEAAGKALPGPDSETKQITGPGSEDSSASEQSGADSGKSDSTDTDRDTGIGKSDGPGSGDSED